MVIKKMKSGGSSDGNQESGFSIKRTVEKLSGTEKTDIIVNGIQSLTAIIDGITTLSKEREKTKRKVLEHEVEMKSLDNKLEQVLSEERVKLATIQNEFMLNYKQLENQSDRDMRQAKIIEKMLDTIDNFSDKLSSCEKRYGFDNPNVIRIEDKLHELSITLTNQLRLQG